MILELLGTDGVSWVVEEVELDTDIDLEYPFPDGLVGFALHSDDWVPGCCKDECDCRTETLDMAA